MSDELVCWRCGASLEALTLPLSRLDECPSCGIQVHVCRLCEYFAPGKPKQCREDDAEEVKEKERANFCDYLRPRAGAFDAAGAAAEQQARAQLAALFGGGGPATPLSGTTAADTEAARAAESLFGKPGKPKP